MVAVSACLPGVLCAAAPPPFAGGEPLPLPGTAGGCVVVVEDEEPVPVVVPDCWTTTTPSRVTCHRYEYCSVPPENALPGSANAAVNVSGVPSETGPAGATVSDVTDGATLATGTGTSAVVGASTSLSRTSRTNA